MNSLLDVPTAGDSSVEALPIGRRYPKVTPRAPARTAGWQRDPPIGARSHDAGFTNGLRCPVRDQEGATAR